MTTMDSECETRRAALMRLRYKAIIVVLLWQSCVGVPVKQTCERTNQGAKICLQTWQAQVDFSTLTLHGGKHEETPILLATGARTLPKPSTVTFSDEGVNLHYDKLKLTVGIFARGDRLHIRASSKLSQEISLFTLASDPRFIAMMLPEGEGIYVPLASKFWHAQLSDVTMGTQGTDTSVDSGLLSPFWGLELGNATLSFIAHTDLNNRIRFFVDDGRLVQTFSHLFSQGIDEECEVSMTLTEKSALAPAFNYKRYLIENGSYKTLKEKIVDNPQVQKLIGAMHAYAWGDGRTSAALNDIAQIGIQRLWIGYEDKPPREPSGAWVKKQHYVDRAFVLRAKELGFLVGPYDSFHTMMPTKDADAANVVFNGHYPNACVIKQDGSRTVGFGQRGCYASSEAFVTANHKNQPIYDRVDAFLATGINSYFVDCDATGELFDDFSPAHPMSKAKDRINRLERLRYIADKKMLVLGSETAAAWAVPVLTFAHGNVSVRNRAHFSMTKDKKRYGAWWPPERPAFFFKKLDAPVEYVSAKYDPAFRLPLFQAVFHEAIVTTDRWEIPLNKFSNLRTTRSLLELLYGVPAVWSLDRKEIRDEKVALRKLADFFMQVHEEIALLPITHFMWLTSDRLVQAVTFGDRVQMVANFSSKSFDSVAPKTIQARWLKEKKVLTYEP